MEKKSIVFEATISWINDFGQEVAVTVYAQTAKDLLKKIKVIEKAR